jgi:hypothetical protein
LRGAKGRANARPSRRSNPFFLAVWIASLSSGAHSRDPLARNDGGCALRLPETFPHPGLDLRHACDPAIIILGLLAHIAQDLRVRQNHKSFLLDSGQRVVGDLLRRQVAVASALLSLKTTCTSSAVLSKWTKLSRRQSQKPVLGIVGSYHKVSRKYLPLYTAEFQ